MDYIYITDKDNNKLKMEVASIFDIDNSPFHFIIYCKPDRSHYYLAKYMDNVEDLYTDITNEELEVCNKIFKEVIKNETRS